MEPRKKNVKHKTIIRVHGRERQKRMEEKKNNIKYRGARRKINQC